MSASILSTALSGVKLFNLFDEVKVKKAAKGPTVPVVESLTNSAVDFATQFNIGINPYTGVNRNLPFWKAGGYSSMAEKVLDHDRFCLEKDIRDMVSELSELESDFVAAKRKEAISLEKKIGELKLKLAKKVLKLESVVKKLVKEYGFQSWYGDLFSYPTDAQGTDVAAVPQATTSPKAENVAPETVATPAPVLLSGEELAKRFMEELLNTAFLAELAKKQPGEAELADHIRHRGEAVILGLKDQTDPDDFKVFYEAFKENYSSSEEPELKVIEPAIVEVVMEDGEPRSLEELVKAAGPSSATLMAEKLAKAAKAVQKAKRRK